MSRKIFIIGGGGMVGATIAHSLAITETASDIRLIDIAEELLAGQAMDISHATAHTRSVHVSVANYDEIEKDDIIVISSGLPQKPGQTRLELLNANAAIIRDVTRKVMRQGKPVFIVIVANPVDVLTRVALEESGLPKQRVLGTGTSLDTARLRTRLAQLLHVSPQAVQAYIMGEHGDSSFPALSGANIGGIPLAQFPGFEASQIATIDEDIRRAAYQIIESKKSTYYGIGQTVTKLVDALLHNKAQIFPVCSLLEGEYGLHDVVIGVPSLVSAMGSQPLDGYPLNDDELRQLHASAVIISEAYASLK